MARMQAPNGGPIVGVADEKVERMLGHGYTVLDGDSPAPGSPSGGETPTPPPLGGAGSGVEAWLLYAQELKVDVDGLEKRDDIVEAIKAAGHPVEAQA